MIQLHSVDLHYATKTILHQISLEIQPSSTIGLIGVNGAGKSSFMRVLAGDVDIDSGALYTRGATSVAYLSQDPREDFEKWKTKPILTWYYKQKAHNSIHNTGGFDLASILSLDLQRETDDIHTIGDIITNQKLFLIQQYKFFGYTDKELIACEHDFMTQLYTHLRRFQLDQSILSADIQHVSGGQLRKIGLALVLSTSAHITLLDEPTNHLDLESIIVLETYIQSIKKRCIVFVSHDRFFTDNVAHTMWELDKGRIKQYTGNYSQFLAQKAAQQTRLTTETWKQKQYLKRELEWVKSGVKARGTKDKGRLDRFKHEEELYKKNLSHHKNTLSILLPHMPRLGSKIIEITRSSCTIGETPLWKDVTISVQKYHKIGILGKNGSGKSTFLAHLTNTLDHTQFHTTGTLKVGENTIFLTYDQHKTIDDETQNAFTYIGHGREYLTYHSKQGVKQISTRHYLRLWLFDKDMYERPISQLSGGEKSRLILAKHMLQPANVLVLDEPTNDLDLETMLILEQALKDFEGVVIVISHDRTFLDKVCNQIWFFDDIHHTIKVIDGNYSTITSYFNPHTFELISELEQEMREEAENVSLSESKEIRSLKKEIARLETQISKQEEIVFELQSRFQNPTLFTQLDRVAKLKSHLDTEERTLQALLEKWEVLTEKLHL